MKKLAILIFAALASVNSNAIGEKPFENPDPRLVQLKKEVAENLTKNLLPYWSTRMVDYKNGGFYGRIDVNDKVYPNEDKGGILNARILWTYSSAYRVLGDTAYLRLAKRAKNYIMACFIDRIYGGAYRSVKPNGIPSDTRKQVYTQSFFIYGLSEYYRATGDKEALESAKAIFELLEKYALDREAGGYFEVFDRQWQRSHDLLIGESTVKDEKTMNTHLHVMEAYANLYKAWPDKRVAESLRKLIVIFLDRIADPQTSHLICFMDRNWKRTSETDSYGHDIESSWLLYESALQLSDPVLLSRVMKTSIKIAAAAADGLQSDGSIIYEKDRVTGRENRERSWWAQAETVVGYLNAFEMTRDEKYLEKSLNCWNYIKNHIVDARGGWFSSVSESGLTGKGDKGGFWVCPYHNGRMCLEVIERISY
jgi:mannobiose 2-epimerase